MTYDNPHQVIDHGELLEPAVKASFAVVPGTADVIENLARDRVCKLYGAEHANVQPHSGSTANECIYRAVLDVGDTILAMQAAGLEVEGTRAVTHAAIAVAGAAVGVVYLRPAGQ